MYTEITSLSVIRPISHPTCVGRHVHQLMDHDLQLKHPISDDYYSSNHHGHALLLSLFLPTKPSRASTPSLLRSMLLKCTGVLSSSKLKGKITVWFFLRRVNQKEALLGFSLLSFQLSVATTSNTMSFSLAQASRSVSLHVLSFLFVF